LRKTGWVAAVGAGLLVACASAQPRRKVAAAAPQDNGLICEESPITGSHIPRRVCRSAQQVKEDREQAQKARSDGNRTQPSGDL
jgi:hypothetical protein